VGLIFQDADSQIVGETVAADVAFGPENLCLPAAEVGARVEAALETVGLTALADQTPQALSGGEKRRLSIAGVLAMHPQIVVFDEPFAGLDFPGTRQVLREMLRLQEAGHTLLMATHDLEKIIYHADRLIVMNGGRIVKDGPPAGILGEIESFGVRAPCVSRLGLEAESWLS
jgi:biotin transport system ATP-binding protein